MNEDSLAQYSWAVEDFRRARHRANLRGIISRLKSGPRDLLSYEEVKRKLDARESPRRQLKDIPLEAIIGSVGRYKDFTRDFLPRRESDEQRWARVKVAMTSMEGVPPIEAYQIGEVYFVLDGNHRVSVARELEATHIQAYVREVQTRVPIERDTDPSDLLRKAEYSNFLKQTKLDENRPQADFEMTEWGGYAILEDQIESCRHQPTAGNGDTRSLEQAAMAWFDDAYLPLIDTIREKEILRGHPGRTETDLYVWISQHHAALEESLGWQIKPEVVADAFRETTRGRGLSEVGRRLIGASVPKSAPPERWRAGVFEGFGYPLDVLVALSGEPDGWAALEQAQIIARREGARLLGLHVVESKVDLDSERALAVKAGYQAMCGAEAISCHLAFDIGDISEKISERARWTDLVVAHLAHPPGGRLGDGAGSGFRHLIRDCPQPILAVPDRATPMNVPLLAYDGSAKSVEALYLVTYLCGRWQTPLSILTVTEGESVGENSLEEANQYVIGRGIQPNLIQAQGDVAAQILRQVEDSGADLLVMGGYGHSQLAEAILGSTVDEVIGHVQVPVLICR